MDMIDEAKKHMVPPFEVPVFADPRELLQQQPGWLQLPKKHLKINFEDFSDKKIVILGGTGLVGVASAVISAKAGMNIAIGSLRRENIARYNEKYGSKSVVGAEDGEKANFLIDADVVLTQALLVYS